MAKTLVTAVIKETGHWQMTSCSAVLSCLFVVFTPLRF